MTLENLIINISVDDFLTREKSFFHKNREDPPPEIQDQKQYPELRSGENITTCAGGRAAPRAKLGPFYITDGSAKKRGNSLFFLQKKRKILFWGAQKKRNLAKN